MRDRDVSDEEEIQVGDVVQVNSGGPSMTVRKIEKDDASVFWMNADGAKNYTFPVKALERE